MAILEQLQEQIEDLKQELEIQKADKQELQRLKDVQEIQNVMCQYEYLHYPILFPEKLNVFALDMPDVSMDVGDSGVFVGREGIETVFLKILGSARFAKGAFFMHCITRYKNCQVVFYFLIHFLIKCYNLLLINIK